MGHNGTFDRPSYSSLRTFDRSPRDSAGFAELASPPPSQVSREEVVLSLRRQSRTKMSGSQFRGVTHHSKGGADLTNIYGTKG